MKRLQRFISKILHIGWHGLVDILVQLPELCKSIFINAFISWIHFKTDAISITFLEAVFLFPSFREEATLCPSCSRRSRQSGKSRSASPGSAASPFTMTRLIRWWAGPGLRSGGLMWPTLRWWWRWSEGMEESNICIKVWCECRANDVFMWDDVDSHNNHLAVIYIVFSEWVTEVYWLKLRAKLIIN